MNYPIERAEISSNTYRHSKRNGDYVYGNKSIRITQGLVSFDLYMNPDEFNQFIQNLIIDRSFTVKGKAEIRGTDDDWNELNNQEIVDKNQSGIIPDWIENDIKYQRSKQLSETIILYDSYELTFDEFKERIAKIC